MTGITRGDGHAVFPKPVIAASDKLLAQNDPRFLDASRSLGRKIHDSGCNALVLAGIGQLEVERFLDAESIVELLDFAITAGYASESLNVTHESLFLDAVFRLLGREDMRANQVGFMEGDKALGWAGGELRDDGYKYLKYRWNVRTAHGVHFTLHDKTGMKIYDPFDGEIPYESVNARFVYNAWKKWGIAS